MYVNPGVGCGQCRHCRAGEPTRCDSYTFMGYFGFGPGSQQVFEKYPYAGYAEFMTAPASNLVRLPDNLSSAQAARLGYLGTAHSAIRKSALRPGQTMLILGTTGTLGVGATPTALYGTVLSEGLISRLDHAAYLGRELAQAQHALTSGEDYVQDRAPGEEDVPATGCGPDAGCVCAASCPPHPR